jgi:hypothetical protein
MDRERQSISSTNDSGQGERKRQRVGSESLNELEFEKALDKYLDMKQTYDRQVKNALERIKLVRKTLGGLRDVVSIETGYDEGFDFKKARKQTKEAIANIECQNCKRKVGMIFNRTFNETNLTTVLSCKCGSTSNPCNLNISIQLGTTFNLRDEIKESGNEINEYKKKIIIDKNKLLFGFMTTDQVLKNYEEIKQELNNSFENNETSSYLYNELITNSKDGRNKETTRTQIEYNNYVQELRENMKKFEISRDKQYLDRAVELHKMISEKAVELRNLKYRDMRVEQDENDNKFNLVQCAVTYDELENNISSDNKVLSFITNANAPAVKPTSVTNIFSILPTSEQKEDEKSVVEEPKSEEEEEKKEEKQEEKKEEEPKPKDNPQSGFELIEENVMSLFK